MFGSNSFNFQDLYQPNKILIRVIGCVIVGWQVLPDQLAAVIWSHCQPTSPNIRILFAFQYKSITTTNKHCEVWYFLKDKQHLNKEKKNAFECFHNDTAKYWKYQYIKYIFLDTGHRYRYLYISRKKVQYPYLEDKTILYST